MLKEFSRRALGIVLGALMGLGYGLVSTYINVLALPGIPLQLNGPARPVAVLIIVLFGGLLGLLAAWPDEAIPGVIVSSLAGVVLSSAAILLEVRESPTTLVETFVGLFISLLPRAFLFIPVAALVRWVLVVLENQLQYAEFSFVKIALSVVAIFGVSLLSGSVHLYPKEARLGLQDTHALVQLGQQAASRAEVPQPLKAVDGFFQRGRGQYVLAVNNNPDRYPVQRPFADYGVDEYAVTVRFDNKYRFVCIYTPPNVSPSCGEY
jgi:hypothetical protein